MNAATPERPLTVVRAAQIDVPGPAVPAWLVTDLWGDGAVGVLGGPPKSCKSWLALELATAVASGRPCLGRFAIAQPGPVLLYAAEDSPLQVRHRLEQLCSARGASFDTLDLDVVVEPALRIDRTRDVERLRATLDTRPYRLLILDPYVRLQAADENHAPAVAAILATLRTLSRTYSLALLLVHHARKAAGDAAGLALRGSSDFHAWGDSNLYLRRRSSGLLLTTEHRAAAAPPPLSLTLADHPLRLEIRDAADSSPATDSLEPRILVALTTGPLHLEALRAAVSARKQSVLHSLRSLETTDQVVRNAHGWQLAPRPDPVPAPHPYIAGNREPPATSAIPSDPTPPTCGQLDLIDPPSPASPSP